MAAMQWSNDLSTTIKLMDEQHKELIRRMNDVVEAGKTGDVGAMRFTLFMLQDFCVAHFSCEENLQIRACFPDFEGHRNFHRQFLSKIAELLDEMKGKGPSKNYIDEISKIVGNWLVLHIKTVDGVLADFIRKEAPELIDFV